MRRPVALMCLFALFLLAGRAVAQPMPPSVSCTGATPGLGAGMINVSYTYKNAPTAKSVRIYVINPPNMPAVSVWPIGANGKGSNSPQTQWFNTAVTVEVELLDANSQPIVKSAQVGGMTK